MTQEPSAVSQASTPPAGASPAGASPAATPPEGASPGAARPAATSPDLARRLLAGLARWEVLLIFILGIMIWAGTSISPVFIQPDFWNSPNFGASISGTMEVAIMALAMTPIIIMGDIDLSVESMVGLSGAVLGVLFTAGIPLQLGIPIVLVVGAIGGLFNGLLVTRWGLPALVVTLGTLALYRGLANVVLGTSYVTGFPSEYTAFGFGYVPGTQVPWTLLAFLILAVVFWAVLHMTWIGRQIFAIGRNKDAARYSGVRVARLKTALFVLSGMVAAFAGIVLALRYNSVRSDNGTGLTLTVVMIAVLGGVDINGGKGTIPGVILAVFTLAALQSALRLAGVSGEYQNVAIGLLLIVSVIGPQLARQLRALVARVRQGRPRPARDPVPGEIVR
jgi:rhamnose transport system permease protein